MKDKTVLSIVIGVATLTGIVTALAANSMIFASSPLLENLLIAKVFFTSFNIVVLTALTHNYINIYRNVPTPISRDLMIFSLALTLYAFSSSPIIHILTGFESVSIGPFTYLPDMFVTAASVIMLYESYK